ncbi:hypothetical protein [Nocardia sp. IFM 10818]
MCLHPPPTSARRGPRSWMRATRRDGNVIAWVILMLAGMLLLLMGIQGALYYHARSIAIGAGEESLKQAASQYGNVGTGTAAGYAFIAASGPGVLQTPAVIVTRDLSTARVSITGSVPTLVWFWHPVVHIDLARPVERITTPGVPT